MTGAAKNTVAKLLADLGEECARYQDRTLLDLPCTTIQCDEIWSYCYAKQKNVPDEHKGTFGYGDVWTWTAHVEAADKQRDGCGNHDQAAGRKDDGIGKHLLQHRTLWSLRHVPRRQGVQQVASRADERGKNQQDSKGAREGGESGAEP
jgi:hypothetical protein